MPTPHKNKHILLGALALIAAFFVGTLQNALVKLIADKMAVTNIVMTQYVVCLLLYWPIARQKKITVFAGQHKGLLTLRTAAGLSYFLTTFYALKFIPLTDAALLSNTAPLWVPILCFFFSNEKASLSTFASILFGFCGVALILAPEEGIKNMGAFLALFGGLSMAVGMIANRKLASKEPMPRVLMYYFAVSAICTAPLMTSHWPTNASVWAILFTTGALMLLQQALIYTGFKCGPPSVLGITAYTGVIFASILDWVIWKHPMTSPTLIGALIIITAAINVLLAPLRKPEISPVTTR